MLEANIYKEKFDIFTRFIFQTLCNKGMQQRGQHNSHCHFPLQCSPSLHKISLLFSNTCVVPVFDKNDKWFAQNISQVSQSLDVISHKHLSNHVLVDLKDYGMGVEGLMVAQMGNFLVDNIVVEDMHSVS